MRNPNPIIFVLINNEGLITIFCYVIIHPRTCTFITGIYELVNETKLNLPSPVFERSNNLKVGESVS